MSSPPAGLPGVPQPGDYQGSLAFDGYTRTYFLHLPPAYDGRTALPLVLVLHGGGQNAEGIAELSGFNSRADESGFIVVYPNGTGRLEERVLTWNAGHCCTYALANQVDDVGFIRALLDELERTLRVDRQRIYATGISNGGMMAYRLGAELADRIAAIAPVAGTIGGQASPGAPQWVIPQPSRPVSVIAFHGEKDRLVPYSGGHGDESRDYRIDLPVADSIAFWVQANGCDPVPQREGSSGGKIIRETYSGCREGAEVVLYTLVEGGHSWPGGELGPFAGRRAGISATDVMVEFFLGHPKR